MWYNTEKGKGRCICLTLYLEGRIDSANASEVEASLLRQIGGEKPETLMLDAEALEYISSAGLRVILRLKKAHPSLSLVNVSSAVYEIFDMTGFTEMMPVKKAYRAVSVEGCEVIGEGFNGKVYRIDQDNVVKVYKRADALEAIQHEREVARLALVLGVPTAISYDVVRVGDHYGSVFELLNARSFAKILAKEPEKLDWCVRENMALLKKVHSIRVPEGKLPSGRETLLDAARQIRGVLPEALGEKLIRLIEAVPESDHMLHGDFHSKNIELSGDEVLLIDMDTLCVGDPIFELGQMYNSYVGFSELDIDQFRRFQGYEPKIGRAFWKQSLQQYLGLDDDELLRAAEEKIRVIAYTLLISWAPSPEEASEKDRAELALWTRELIELLERVDSLSLAEYLQ